MWRPCEKYLIRVMKVYSQKSRSVVWFGLTTSYGVWEFGCCCLYRGSLFDVQWLLLDVFWIFFALLGVLFEVHIWLLGNFWWPWAHFGSQATLQMCQTALCPATWLWNGVHLGDRKWKKKNTKIAIRSPRRNYNGSCFIFHRFRSRITEQFSEQRRLYERMC